jgi:hypothetical protein
MSDNKLTVLGIMAAFSIVLAVFVSQFAHRSKQTSAGPGNLIQGLDPANIAEIVAGKGNKQVSLKRRGNGFIVANKSFYPASNKAINDLIASCLDIRTVELYTEDKANYKDLGVTEEDAKDIVKFLDSDGKIITGVIIGNSREKDGMTYGRLINDDKVYIIYNPPWIKQSPLDYVEQELISVNKADINSVTVTSLKEAYTLVSEANGTEVVLQQPPEGKKQRKNECNAAFSVLTNLRFDDVNTVSEKPDLNFDRKYSCLLKDSSLYIFEIARKDSVTFVKCRADFTDKTPIKKEQDVESEEELKKKEAKLLARDKAKKFQEACEGWIYQIPEYKAKNMTKPRAELMEDVNSEPSTTMNKNGIDAPPTQISKIENKN